MGDIGKVIEAIRDVNPLDMITVFDMVKLVPDVLELAAAGASANQLTTLRKCEKGAGFQMTITLRSLHDATRLVPHILRLAADGAKHRQRRRLASSPDRPLDRMIARFVKESARCEQSTES